MSSAGFGVSWGHTRSFGNIIGESSLGINGNNWFVEEIPLLVFDVDGSVGMITSPDGALWFKPDGLGGYKPMFALTSILYYDGDNDQYVVMNSKGSCRYFYGDDSGMKGAFKGISNRNGLAGTTEYNEDNQLVSFVIVSEDESQSIGFYYTYYTEEEDADNAGQLQEVTYQVNGVDVRQCYYEYYPPSSSLGNQHDLASAVVSQYDPLGETWTDLSTCYYRYYVPGDEAAFTGGLKFVVGPEAYARMAAASIDPWTASEETLAGYADHYFEYDSQHRVTLEKAKGGSYESQFSHSPSSNSGEDYNVWMMKTTELTQDGNTNIVYTNFAGQVMLKVFNDTWFTYVKYDDAGRGIWRAGSSFVYGYSEENTGLAYYHEDEGLVHVFTYYDDEGSAPGYLMSEAVRQGYAGDDTLLYTLDYSSTSAGGNTIYEVSSRIEYQSDASGGSDPAETDYSNSYFSGTGQIQSISVTLPEVPTEQNGSGASDATSTTFDESGNLIEFHNGRGYGPDMTYDPATGALTQRTDYTGTETLVTDYEFDAQGRTTQELGPEHQLDLEGTPTDVRRAKWTVYRDDIDQVWTAQGYTTDGETYTLINPVHIMQTDLDGRVTDVIEATGESTSGRLDPSDSFAQSSWTRWKHTEYDDQSHLAGERVYFLIPSSGDGTSGTNYNETTYGYDASNRRNRVETPAGTITRTVYNACGWVLEVWVGTDDTGATDSDPTGGAAEGNNMVKILANEYDGGVDGSGDGNLTQVTAYQDGSNTRVTAYGYDYRNRRTSSDGEVDFYETYAYDNQDRLTQTDRYDTTSEGNLIARNATNYDPLGRVYQKIVYEVDPSTGDVGNSLVDNFWYDPAGNLILQMPAGSNMFQEMIYDEMGRMTTRYGSYNLSWTGYPYPPDVDYDTVMEQEKLIYDEAGNVVSRSTFSRFHDATSTGDLSYPGGSQPLARGSYVALYQDALGRVIANVNYGTNAGVAWERYPAVPEGSDTLLVSLVAYNDRGEAWQKTDPAGKVDQSVFDDAGRVTQLVENYISEGTDADENRETDYTYDANGQLATLTAKNSVTGDQVTAFEYGTTLEDSDVASNELLVTKVYPDDTEEAPDRVTYAYNRLGQLKLMTDQNGTVHTYEYDGLGRLIHDRVTTLGDGVDDAVLRISRGYEVRGMLENATSYDNAAVGSGSIVNDVQMAYNGFMQLETEYQAHGGAVNTSTSPKVQYGYADGSANTIRPVSLTYPNAREVVYDYDSSGSMSDALSRINAIKESSDTRAGYTYLGMGTIVQINYDEPGLLMTYILQGMESPGDAGDQYTGLDRFGRVVDSRWIDAEPADINRVKYGYSAASNRIWRQNPVAGTGQDEFYSYDGLYQLNDLQRGTLSEGNTGISGTPAKEEAFTYDPIGNWENYLVKVSGSTTLDQDREQNKANETTSVSSSSSLVGYDDAGNMTKTPKPADWGNAFDLTYDAWNRRVKVMDGMTTVAVYAYDGVNRRTVKVANSETRHYYYSVTWQILEERTGSSTSADQQFVWGLRGIDDLVLRDVFSPSSERLYALGDAMSVTAVADTSGDVQERYGYDAFGNTNVMDGSFANIGSSAYGWQVRFCGYRWDSEINFYQVRNRYMQPSLGKWLSRDPIMEQGGFNMYAYVFNSPILISDLLGLISSGPTGHTVITSSLNNPSSDPVINPLSHEYDDITDPANAINNLVLNQLGNDNQPMTIPSFTVNPTRFQIYNFDKGVDAINKACVECSSVYVDAIQGFETDMWAIGAMSFRIKGTVSSSDGKKWYFVGTIEPLPETIDFLPLGGRPILATVVNFIGFSGELFDMFDPYQLRFSGPVEDDSEGICH